MDGYVPIIGDGEGIRGRIKELVDKGRHNDAIEKLKIGRSSGLLGSRECHWETARVLHEKLRYQETNRVLGDQERKDLMKGMERNSRIAKVIDPVTEHEIGLELLHWDTHGIPFDAMNGNGSYRAKGLNSGYGRRPGGNGHYPVK